MTSSDDTIHRERFALVMVLSLATVLLTIAKVDDNTTRAIVLLLQGLAFTVAVVAARDHERLRQRTGLALVALLLAACVLTAVGALGTDIRVALSLALALGTPAVMVRGLVRLLRERGVVAQAVFGALALYLQIGLIFAFAAAGIGVVEGEQFFATTTDDSLSDFVYFSFTTMSTTGYGDLTPATQVGRSLAVFEMLIGQIYLVTIVGLLIGNMGRPRAAQ